MPSLSRAANKFIESYAVILPQVKEAANAAERIVADLANETGAFIHAVTARAKSLESVRGKLRRKYYKNPERDMTDVIGVRVITYYRDAVDPIVENLKKNLEIDKKRSVDKRHALGLQDFGYRSVHLIARPKNNRSSNEKIQFLRKHWFEIQVRTILEHSWAEIEHEIVYKSGISYPDIVKRRFAAIAGNLELLDNEFLALKSEKDLLIDSYCDRYREELDQRTPFDGGRLLAFLEVKSPKGLGWRGAAAKSMPFQSGLEASCVEALRTVGLGTPFSLQRMLRSKGFRQRLDTFAAAEGIARDSVSHLAIVVLAVATKRRSLVERQFPEFGADPAIRSAIENVH